jgi:holo-[acyl-carrier protein] synthase
VVAGVGVDIISVARVRSMLERRGARAMYRLFSPGEVAEAGTGVMAYERLASRWAAKEAVLKSLGSGLWQVPLRDIVVTKGQDGRPEVSLQGKAQERATCLGVTGIQVSMSHEHEYAVAFAVALKGDD